MNKTIKGLLWLFLALFILCIPIIVNSLVIGNRFLFGTVVAGKTEVERSWLNFWANYFGCFFSSIVAFVVLFLTLRQNSVHNIQNREDAHNENQRLQVAQEKRFLYELALNHVSEIRTTAVMMYHSLVNSKVDTIYTRALLERIDEIDIKELQTLLMSVLDESNKSYIEMQMLLSYAGERDEEVEKIMDLVKKVMDESYDCIRDLFWVLILCHKSLEDKSLYKTEVYRYATEQTGRIKLPNQKHIWDIIIEREWFNLARHRFEVVMSWHEEWHKINDTYLVAIRGLVHHYYQKAKSTYL